MLILLDFNKASDSLQCNFVVKTWYIFWDLVHPLSIGSLHYTHIYHPQSWITLFYWFFLDWQRSLPKGSTFTLHFYFSEPISASIKKTKHKGEINNTKYLISQFTDDSALMLADDLYSLNVVPDCIYCFDRYSVIRANFNKRQAVLIRVKRGRGEECQTNKQLYWNHKRFFKLLQLHVGIIFNMWKTILWKIILQKELGLWRNLLHGWAFVSG